MAIGRTVRGGPRDESEDSMKVGCKSVTRRVACIAATAMFASVVWTQEKTAAQQSPYLAPPEQIVAIRAGRLFDAKAGTILNNQVVLIKGDRIAAVGPGVSIPAGTRVIDLGSATVLPGMIDGHVHLIGSGRSLPDRTLVAMRTALDGLNAGFTTFVDMNNRDNYATIDLRDNINKGVIPGPRRQVAGPALNPRADAAVPIPNSPGNSGADLIDPYGVHSPWLARGAVRLRKWYGTDWIKIYGTMDFEGEEYHVFKPDGSMVNSPSLTLEEIQAVVDEAHRLGLRVACHAYGGEGLHSCISSGVDLTMHAAMLDDTALRMLVQNKLPLQITLYDLFHLDPADKRVTGGKTSRLDLTEKAFRKARAAGVPLPFGSGTLSSDNPYTSKDRPSWMAVGGQAIQFKYMVDWGMSPAEALQTTFMVAANVLNYGWSDRVGSLEQGKYADIIAVAGDPLKDVTEMERVKFVMKGGVVIKNELNGAPTLRR